MGESAGEIRCLLNDLDHFALVCFEDTEGCDLHYHEARYFLQADDSVHTCTVLLFAVRWPHGSAALVTRTYFNARNLVDCHRNVPFISQPRICLRNVDLRRTSKSPGLLVLLLVMVLAMPPPIICPTLYWITTSIFLRVNTLESVGSSWNLPGIFALWGRLSYMAHFWF